MSAESLRGFAIVLHMAARQTQTAPAPTINKFESP
ncbi:hypothetical protein CBM2626_B10243 [Cupriavidus taiwanensis]|nr:hypothetical protein CBM2626_B10243 [Cupriavidus taiwanensis]